MTNACYMLDAPCSRLGGTTNKGIPESSSEHFDFDHTLSDFDTSLLLSSYLTVSIYFVPGGSTSTRSWKAALSGSTSGR